MQNVEFDDFTQAEKFMQELYIDKLLAHLRGESDRIATNKEFMMIHQCINYQTDTRDSSAALYDYFKRCLTAYITNDMLPTTKGKAEDRLLESYC